MAMPARPLLVLAALLLPALLLSAASAADSKSNAPVTFRAPASCFLSLAAFLLFVVLARARICLGLVFPVASLGSGSGYFGCGLGSRGRGGLTVGSTPLGIGQLGDGITVVSVR
jgi:hypothetical protein